MEDINPNIGEVIMPMLVVGKDEKSGFYFIMKRHLPVTFKTIRFFIATVVITILLSLALFAFFAGRISSNFFEPIKNLNNAMILVSISEDEIDVPALAAAVECDFWFHTSPFRAFRAYVSKNARFWVLWFRYPSKSNMEI